MSEKDLTLISNVLEEFFIFSQHFWVSSGGAVFYRLVSATEEYYMDQKRRHWFVNGMKGEPPNQYENAKVVFDVEPNIYIGNRSKGGQFEFDLDADQLNELRDLVNNLVKEAEAEQSIREELKKFNDQLNDEAHAMREKKRAELRAKAGLEPDERDQAAAERERKEALDILNGMEQPQQQKKKK
jgi:hypothetical protein